MQDDVIKRALRAAATHNCICYGECFETRHGMMNGPCEAELGPTAAAIAAFLEAMGEAACFIGWLGLVEEDGWQNKYNMPSYPDTVGQSRYGSNAFATYMQIASDHATLFAYEDGYPVFWEHDDDCVDYMTRITPQMVIDKLNHFLQTGQVINHRPEDLCDADDE